MGVKQLKTNLELAGTTLQDAERNDQDPLMKYDIYIDYIYINIYKHHHEINCNKPTVSCQDKVKIMSQVVGESSP